MNCNDASRYFVQLLLPKLPLVTNYVTAFYYRS